MSITTPVTVPMTVGPEATERWIYWISGGWQWVRLVTSERRFLYEAVLGADRRPDDRTLRSIFGRADLRTYRIVRCGDDAYCLVLVDKCKQVLRVIQVNVWITVIELSIGEPPAIVLFCSAIDRHVGDPSERSTIIASMRMSKPPRVTI